MAEAEAAAAAVEAEWRRRRAAADAQLELAVERRAPHELHHIPRPDAPTASGAMRALANDGLDAPRATSSRFYCLDPGGLACRARGVHNKPVARDGGIENIRGDCRQLLQDVHSRPDAALALVEDLEARAAAAAAKHGGGAGLNAAATYY